MARDFQIDGDRVMIRADEPADFSGDRPNAGADQDMVDRQTDVGHEAGPACLGPEALHGVGKAGNGSEPAIILGPGRGIEIADDDDGA